MMKPIAIVCVALFMTAAACRRAESPPKRVAGSRAQKPSELPVAPTRVGDAMPPYAAKTLDGKPFDLRSERGKVVLLNVWATWCGPCRFEIPELQAMHDRYGKRGFEVIGVSVDEGEPAEVKTFVVEQKVTYPVALDPEQKIANVLQTVVLPTTVLIDRKGKIVWRQIGALTPHDPKLEAAIEAATAAPKT